MNKKRILMILVITYISLVTLNGCTKNVNEIKSDSTNNIEGYEPMLMLVNDKYWIEENFIPTNLEDVNIPFSGAASNEEKQMEYEGAKALEKLVKGALDKGIYLYGVSGYRSFKLQQHIYDVNVDNNGQEYTNRYVAIPGRSEHQIGLAMDLGDSSGNLIQNSREVDWVKENSHLYGFILRYPQGKEYLTGYSYEPWHIRYVGIDVATEIYNKDITFEEYYEY